MLDYKTGGRYGVDVLADDPVARGTRLQLVLYGMAAAHRYQADGPVDVGYWFVSDRGSVRGRFPRDGFRLTAAAEGRFQDVLRTLVDAIEAGRFPANPGPPEGLGGRGRELPDLSVRPNLPGRPVAVVGSQAGRSLGGRVRGAGRRRMTDAG